MVAVMCNSHKSLLRCELKKFIILIVGMFVGQTILAMSLGNKPLQQEVVKENIGKKIDDKEIVTHNKNNDLKPFKITVGGVLYLIYDKDTTADKIEVIRVCNYKNKKKITQSTISRSAFLEVKNISDNLKYINREVNKVQVGTPNENKQLSAIIPILDLEKIKNDMHRLKELLEGKKIKPVVYEFNLESGGFKTKS
jgi:hypothetical protein